MMDEAAMVANAGFLTSRPLRVRLMAELSV